MADDPLDGLGAPAAGAPVFDPSTADIGALLTSGQALLKTLAPLNQAITEDQAALAATQAKMQADQAAASAALAAVQDAGHTLTQVISAQFFLTTSPSA